MHRTKNIDDGHMGSGKILKLAIAKYGLSSFKKDIMFVYESEHKMIQKEIELVTRDFCLREDTYNIKNGGKGGFDHINCDNSIRTKGHNKEMYLRVSESLSGRSRPDISSRMKKAHADGKFDGVVRRKHFLGKQHTDETKEKMSKSHKGKHLKEKNSQYGTMWITDGLVNKKIKVDSDIPDGYYKGRKI